MAQKTGAAPNRAVSLLTGCAGRHLTALRFGRYRPLQASIRSTTHGHAARWVVPDRGFLRPAERRWPRNCMEDGRRSSVGRLFKCPGTRSIHGLRLSLT